MRRNQSSVMRFRRSRLIGRKRRNGVPYRQRFALREYRSEALMGEVIERKERN